ncbi:hypothetical protein GK047_07940 [Paenibacillus sp. SYP-B3998]|uniref:Uncharacterized protein n=1 Tax=Paenibacillus sp. SYP-B3998 TaxID=2678564 RepID=A0A6G3ZV70_9BACL|nr:hypothetical protein [Paenibacillus sp. SYP-B3998]NEW05938.1 hypothetical protein [Paenibacillus sp. SYP-B3998]
METTIVAIGSKLIAIKEKSLLWVFSVNLFIISLILLILLFLVGFKIIVLVFFCALIVAISVMHYAIPLITKRNIKGYWNKVDAKVELLPLLDYIQRKYGRNSKKLETFKTNSSVLS